MTKYLRSKNNGMILEWNAVLARNPSVEEVTEQEAYPERFAPVDLAKRTAAVEISVPKEVVTPPPNVSPELLAEASKPFGLGKPVLEDKPTKRQGKPTARTPSESSNIVGLLGEF